LPLLIAGNYHRSKLENAKAFAIPPDSQLPIKNWPGRVELDPDPQQHKDGRQRQQTQRSNAGVEEALA
jgi:hypothetical protein